MASIFDTSPLMAKSYVNPFAVLRIKPARKHKLLANYLSVRWNPHTNVGAYNLVANIRTPHLAFYNIDQFL